MLCIYADRGVDGESLKELNRSLSQAGFPVRRLDAAALIATPWERESKLLIVPGGRDLFYLEALQGRGVEKICAFVERGGSYLGICAGAYFASGSIEFEKGNSLEVCGERPLKFYPGIACGPAYGPKKFSYDNASGAEAAAISWGDGECRVYYNGGCTFKSVEEHSSVSVLSRYLDLPEQPPAIIQTRVGKGKAVLSGVHFEYSPNPLRRDDPRLGEIYSLLDPYEFQRTTLFKEVLHLLI